MPKYLECCQNKIISLVAQRNSGGAHPGCSSVEGPVRIKVQSGDKSDCANIVTKPSTNVISSSLIENIDSPSNRRLELLKRYGEPPPISPLLIYTPTIVKCSFRPPLRKLSEKS